MAPPKMYDWIVASKLLPVSTTCLALVIFIVDTVTDLEIAVAVFYIAVVLISVRFCQSRGVFLIATACMGLTLLSYFLTRAGNQQSGIINCVISLSAIAISTYLVLKIMAAEKAAYEARVQLAKSAGLAVLGELTASIAHEINQPLAALITSGNACLRWLCAEVPNLDKARQAVERIIKDGRRAGDVVARVRSLAKGAPPRMELLAINETILEVVGFMKSELKKNLVSLDTHLEADLPLVHGDRIQVQQVLLNLIMNAVEAIAAGNGMTRDVQITSSSDDSGGIRVAVRDSGVGLTADTGEQLFNAFYTTKTGGMGIGLAISRTIIEAHRGRIWATPNGSGGATLQFTLPIPKGPPA